MIVRDLLQKTDQELVAMLEEIGHEPIEWTPVVLAELSRRAIGAVREETRKLQASSARLEKLTIALLILTLGLAILALPPAVDVAREWIEADPRGGVARHERQRVDTPSSSADISIYMVINRTGQKPFPTNRSVYRVDSVAHRVITWEPGYVDAPSLLRECAVRDLKNWSCLDSSGRVVMNDGKFWRDGSKDLERMGGRYVSREEWERTRAQLGQPVP
jgi:hypothetical protein